MGAKYFRIFLLYDISVLCVFFFFFQGNFVKTILLEEQTVQETASAVSQSTVGVKVSAKIYTVFHSAAASNPGEACVPQSSFPPHP